MSVCWVKALLLAPNAAVAVIATIAHVSKSVLHAKRDISDFIQIIGKVIIQTFRLDELRVRWLEGLGYLQRLRRLECTRRLHPLVAALIPCEECLLLLKRLVIISSVY